MYKKFTNKSTTKTALLWNLDDYSSNKFLSFMNITIKFLYENNQKQEQTIKKNNLTTISVTHGQGEYKKFTEFYVRIINMN